jgi:hypothetical protein
VYRLFPFSGSLIVFIVSHGRLLATHNSLLTLLSSLHQRTPFRAKRSLRIDRRNVPSPQQLYHVYNNSIVSSLYSLFPSTIQFTSSNPNNSILPAFTNQLLYTHHTFKFHIKFHNGTRRQTPRLTRSQRRPTRWSWQGRRSAKWGSWRRPTGL